MPLIRQQTQMVVSAVLGPHQYAKAKNCDVFPVQTKDCIFMKPQNDELPVYANCLMKVIYHDPVSSRFAAKGLLMKSRSVAVGLAHS